MVLIKASNPPQIQMQCTKKYKLISKQIKVDFLKQILLSWSLQQDVKAVRELHPAAGGELRDVHEEAQRGSWRVWKRGEGGQEAEGSGAEGTEGVEEEERTRRQSCILVTFETLISILTNCEPEFILNWQLIVTLDIIRNSCDVFSNFCHNYHCNHHYHHQIFLPYVQNLVFDVRKIPGGGYKDL